MRALRGPQYLYQGSAGLKYVVRFDNSGSNPRWLRPGQREISQGQAGLSINFIIFLIHDRLDLTRWMITWSHHPGIDLYLTVR